MFQLNTRNGVFALAICTKQKRQRTIVRGTRRFKFIRHTLSGTHSGKCAILITSSLLLERQLRIKLTCAVDRNRSTRTNNLSLLSNNRRGPSAARLDAENLTTQNRCCKYDFGNLSKLQSNCNQEGVVLRCFTNPRKNLSWHSCKNASSCLPVRTLASHLIAFWTVSL